MRIKRAAITISLLLLLSVSMIFINSYKNVYSQDIFSADITKLFTKNTAGIEYTDLGIHIKSPAPQTNTIYYTSAGQYSFNNSITLSFVFDSLPPQGKNKAAHFILSGETGDKELLTSIIISNTELRVSVYPLDQSYIIYAMYKLNNYNIANYSSNAITFCYDYPSKKIEISYGNTVNLLDLNILRDSAGNQRPNENLQDLPGGDLKLRLANYYGGIYIQNINGLNLKVPTDPELFHRLERNLFENPLTDADVFYENNGVLITNDNINSENIVKAAVNPSINFGNQFIKISFSIADLAAQKNINFYIKDAENRQLIIKFQTDFINNKYTLNATIKVQKNLDSYFIKANDLITSDIKELETIDLRYDQLSKIFKIINNQKEKSYNLQKDQYGTNADISLLPINQLIFETEVSKGGIYIESVNSYLYKFDRSLYELNYNTDKDFFAERSDAFIVYRNRGIIINNNDKESVNYRYARMSDKYSFNTSMLFEYKYDGLQVYDPSVPLSIIKGTYFNIYEKGNTSKEIRILPFLYKAGQDYILHVNIIIDGSYTYTNYNIGFNFADYQNITMFMEYNPLERTVEVGSTEQTAVIDLTKAFNGSTQITPPTSHTVTLAEGKFENRGTGQIKFSLADLQSEDEFIKSVWIDFYEQTKGIGVKIFSYYINGNYMAYAEVYHFGTERQNKTKISEIPLGFSFGTDNDLFYDVVVSVTYNPHLNKIYIEKAGENKTEVNIESVQLSKNYNTDISVNYGGILIKDIHGFSAVGKTGAFSFPAPIIKSELIKRSYSTDEKLLLPIKSLFSDIFDTYLNYSIILKDSSDTEIQLANETIQGEQYLSAVLTQTGVYSLKITAANSSSQSVRDLSIYVVDDNTLPLQIVFEQNAFNAFTHVEKDSYQVLKGTTIALPIPQIISSLGYNAQWSVEVKNPEGESIQLDNLKKFSAGQKGTYTIIYTAIDENDYFTESIIILRAVENESNQRGCASIIIGQRAYLLYGIIMLLLAGIIIKKITVKNINTY